MSVSNRTHTGEGAKEALRKYLGTNLKDTPYQVCAIVQWLDDQGFIIVPKGHSAPARRGNSKPPVYTGPELIGKSHTARLIGGASG